MDWFSVGVMALWVGIASVALWGCMVALVASAKAAGGSPDPHWLTRAVSRNAAQITSAFPNTKFV